MNRYGLENYKDILLARFDADKLAVTWMPLAHWRSLQTLPGPTRLKRGAFLVPLLVSARVTQTCLAAILRKTDL